MYSTIPSRRPPAALVARPAPVAARRGGRSAAWCARHQRRADLLWAAAPNSDTRAPTDARRDAHTRSSLPAWDGCLVLLGPKPATQPTTMAIIDDWLMRGQHVNASTNVIG